MHSRSVVLKSVLALSLPSLAFYACGSSARDEGPSGSGKMEFHEESDLPEAPQPLCQPENVPCGKATAYLHRIATCAELGLGKRSVTIDPLSFATPQVGAQLPIGESIKMSPSRVIGRTSEGQEVIYHRWSFTSTQPIDAVILHGKLFDGTPSSNVYEFAPAVAQASALQGAWVEYNERIQFPFDPIAAEICYRQPADETDGGATPDDDSGSNGGKTW